MELEHGSRAKDNGNLMRSRPHRKHISTNCLLDAAIEGYRRGAERLEDIRAQNGPVRIIMKDGVIYKNALAK